MRKFYLWLINFLLKRIEKDSGTVAHAKVELAAVGYDLSQKEEDPDKWICENVLSLLILFSSQGHSGSSAPYCVDYFKKLASFEPLCPLTGKTDEWNDVGDNLMQNKRCSHVFQSRKDAKSSWKAYDGEGKIFREPDGGCFQSIDSRVDITFPYTPKKEYVDVPAQV